MLHLLSAAIASQQLLCNHCGVAFGEAIHLHNAVADDGKSDAMDVVRDFPLP